MVIFFQQFLNLLAENLYGNATVHLLIIVVKPKRNRMKSGKFLLIPAFTFLLLLSSRIYSNPNEEVKIIPLYPKNRSVFVSKNSTLIFTLYPSADTSRLLKETEIKVTGSRSGFIPGKIKLLLKENRIVFQPARIFFPGEQVQVTVRVNATVVTEYSFTVSPKRRKLLSRQDLIDLGYLPPEGKISKALTASGQKTSGGNLPPDFPGYYVSVKNNPGIGYYFLNAGTRDTAKSCYNLIIDTTGFPVFFQRFPPHHRENFFTYHPSVQLITYYDSQESKFKAFNNSFEYVRDYDAQNGYSADIHELILNEDGTYWLLAYDAQNVDMSQIYPGGCTSAVVIGTVIQGIDGDDNVFFQWSSWDHFNILDADSGIVDLTSCLIDYCHGNAITFDSTGNVVLSSRNMSEITKIDRQTGNIIWRLGGNNNQFTFLNDTVPFKGQHHIRYRGNHYYSLFDNGNSRSPAYSRAVSYQLDEQNLTATLHTDFQKHDPADFTPFMGSHQILDNDVHLVGWAANFELNVLTQYAPNGDIQFEVMSVDTFGVTSYRALKFQWETTLFAFDKDSIDFGSTTLVGETAYKPLCVTNPSDKAVTIDGFYSTDSSFSLANTLPVTLAPNSCDTLTISFTPAGTDPVSAAFSLYHQPTTDTVRIAKQLRVMGGGIIDNVRRRPYSSQTLLLMPNPTRSACTVSFGNNASIGEVFIYSANGQLVKTLHAHGKPKLRIEGLSSGLYVIKAVGINGKSAASKLSVH